MDKKINFEEKILVAGSSGMAGSAICRTLNKAGYGDKKLNGQHPLIRVGFKKILI